MRRRKLSSSVALAKRAILAAVRHSRAARCVLALILVLLAAPRAARANMAKAVLDGQRSGTLVPEGATSVRVDREALSFALAPDLASAVTASYQLTNTGAAAEAADVAFVFVRGDLRDDDPTAHAFLEADGAPLRFRAVTDAGLLEPKLRGWLDEHPDLTHALGAPGDPDQAAIRGLVQAAGGRCLGSCDGLVSWYRSTSAEGERRPAGDDAILDAARDAIPGAVADLAGKWTTFTGRDARARLGFLLFHLDFQPGQRRTLTVHYRQQAGDDREAAVNATYVFDYLLSPGRRWAGFGPLDISVHVPGRARFTSPLPFRREGDTYRAELPGLPPGELRFEAMSLDGLWFGMTEPGGYWAILIAAIAAAATAIAAAAGKRWASAAGWKRVGLPLLVAGPLAAVCSLAVFALLMAAYPHHALGFGYGGFLGGLLLVVLAGPVGAALAAIAAARERARERSLAHK